MLVTDGVPYDFTDIFETYNWQNSSYKPVRIFTYLIGKDVADVSKTKDMACQNLGYYVHLSTLPEVREEVLKYLPVMARPLVLGGSHHPVAWSHAYADVQDPLMTDWEWEKKECIEQKELYLERQKNLAFFDSPEARDRRDEFRLQRVSFSGEFGFVVSGRRTCWWSLPVRTHELIMNDERKCLMGGGESRTTDNSLVRIRSTW